MEALNNALFGYINNGLNTLPTSEQIYDPSRFFIVERYEELTSKTIELDNYIFIDFIICVLRFVILSQIQDLQQKLYDYHYL